MNFLSLPNMSDTLFFEKWILNCCRNKAVLTGLRRLGRVAHSIMFYIPNVRMSSDF